MIHRSTCDTPLGRLSIEVTDTGVQRIEFREEDVAPTDGNALLAAVRRQLDEYFAGRRQTFALPLAPIGTPFQQRVWSALLEIGHGRTSSYARIARRIGAPRALRAVGAANGRNPIAVVIPCHRVIGADGALTGYAGGLSRKEALLRLEGALPPEARARAERGHTVSASGSLAIWHPE